MSFVTRDLVLVTGANGHVAQHVVNQLLSLPISPRVRGTVRSERKASELRAFYADKIAEGVFDVFVVDDMTADGAFDEALVGVTHVAHVASPLIITQDDVEKNVLQPAIRGTTGIMLSAAKSPTVKHVVVTSSFGAVADISKGWRPGYTYTERDFNPLTREDALNPDLKFPEGEPVHTPFVNYIASKVLAERAAWNVASSPTCHYKFTVINPTYIFGPSVLPLTNGSDSLSFSNQLIWKTATAAGKPHLPLDWPFMVDVRDVARSHVVALQKDEAAGRRFILSATNFTYTEIAEVVKKHFPDMQTSDGEDQRTIKHWGVDGKPALDILELGSYIPLEQSVLDTLKQLTETVESQV